jgi:hypothetical protein
MTIEKFIHPNVHKWIKANIKKKQAVEYQKELHIFLQELWGPLVNYDFSGLKGGYPSRSLPFLDSLYLYDSELELAFDFGGDSILEGKCSSKAYSAFLYRRNILTVNGWCVLTYCIDNLIEDLTEVKEVLQMIYVRQARYYISMNESFELL